MSTPDPPDQHFMWKFTRSASGTVSFEVMTNNGHYVIRDMAPDTFDAFVRDMTAADDNGDSVEPVLAAWLVMHEQ